MKRTTEISALALAALLASPAVWPASAAPADVTTASAPPVDDVRVKNAVAEFTGMDKITGRVMTFDVYINETVQFGALQITPRVCYSSPDSADPRTDSFVEVDEITLNRKIRRIFTGWMFAESPGLNAIEHPIYDVWLKTCKQISKVPIPDGDRAAEEAAAKARTDAAAEKAKPARAPEKRRPDDPKPGEAPQD